MHREPNCARQEPNPAGRFAFDQFGDPLLLSVDVDIRKADRKLSKLERSQVPFAMSVALNAVAHDVVEDLEPEAQRVFDRPTRFTSKAFRFVRATKRTQSAVVLRKTAQSKRNYFEVQKRGGARRQTGMERKLKGSAALRTLTPAGGARRTAAGNWSPAQRKRALASRVGDGGAFFKVGRGSHLSPGIYERRGRKTKKLVKVAHLTDATPRYTKRLDLVGVAKRRVRRSFASEFRKSLSRAVATSR